MKNLELKFYEKIGVRKFRDIIVKIAYLLILPIYIKHKIPKDKRKKLFYNSPSNYFMKKGNGLKDLKDFKKYLYANAFAHVVTLICFSPFLLNNAFIVGLSYIVLNLYCIMLQRYNYIRIDNTIKKYEEIEKKKINNIKEKIKENTEESLINICYRKNIDINQNIDSMLDNISLKNLKQLKMLILTNKISSDGYLYATFEEDKKSYKIRTKVKTKTI